MVEKMKYASLRTAAFFLLVCQLTKAESTTTPRRRLFGDTPPERNVGGQVCVVGKSGWFGSIGDGTHATIYYGYGVESVPGADTLEILRTVQESVQKKVISEVFPGLCGAAKKSMINYRRTMEDSDQHRQLANQYGISGFHFVPDLKQERRSCLDSQDSSNDCAVYKGKIDAYGTKETDILDVVESHLTNADATMIHPDIVRIFYERVEGYQETNIEIVVEKTEPEDYSEAGKDMGVSAATVLGIAFSIGSVIVALVALSILRKKQNQYDSNNSHMSFDSSVNKNSFDTREDTLPSSEDMLPMRSSAMIPFEDIDLS